MNQNSINDLFEQFYGEPGAPLPRLTWKDILESDLSDEYKESMKYFSAVLAIQSVFAEAE